MDEHFLKFGCISWSYGKAYAVRKRYSLAAHSLYVLHVHDKALVAFAEPVRRQELFHLRQRHPKKVLLVQHMKFTDVIYALYIFYIINRKYICFLSDLKCKLLFLFLPAQRDIGPERLFKLLIIYGL